MPDRIHTQMIYPPEILESPFIFSVSTSSATTRRPILVGSLAPILRQRRRLHSRDEMIVATLLRFSCSPTCLQFYCFLVLTQS